MTDLSLAALRALRAVARCGSFTAAARDLHCAQSAVSRHIAALEQHTGQVLVLRGHRHAQLSPAGETYLESVSRALDELDHGAMRLAEASRGRASVKILAMPAFAARWLVPRLHRLRAANIDVDIDLATSIWDTDYRKERFDLAVHYGDGSLPGAQLLLQDRLVPVAAPALLAGRAPRQLSDLAHFPWLHDALRHRKWQHWLMSCGADDLASPRNMQLQDTEATLGAAVAGLGLAMGHAVLIEHDVRAGRLVEAWPHQAPLAAGYHLLPTKRLQRNPAARAVVAWLQQEAAACRQAANPV